MRKFILLASALVSMAAAVPACASTYALNYSGVFDGSGSPLLASLRIVTSNTLNAAGGYSINSVTGSVDGETVTGITPNPDAPNSTTGVSFTYDNNFFDANPVFNLNGLAFETSAASWNLWGTDPDLYTLFKKVSGVRGYTGASDGSLTITAVPEPASWALLIVGFGMVGTATRRRARTVVA